jgi:hypothetical protein
VYPGTLVQEAHFRRVGAHQENAAARADNGLPLAVRIPLLDPAAHVAKLLGTDSADDRTIELHARPLVMPSGDGAMNVTTVRGCREDTLAAAAPTSQPIPCNSADSTPFRRSIPRAYSTFARRRNWRTRM